MIRCFLALLVLFSNSAFSANFVCGSDLDGSGDINQETEYKPCDLSNVKKTSQPNYYCLTGYSINGKTCEKDLTNNITYTCSAGLYLNNQNNYCYQVATSQASGKCYYDGPQVRIGGDNFYRPGTYFNAVSFTDSSKSTWFSLRMSGNKCVFWKGQIGNGGAGESIVYESTASYSCPAGSTQSGSSCVTYTNPIPAIQSCPIGYTLNNGICSKKEIVDAGMVCPSGSSLNGSVCETISQEYYCPLQVDSTCLSSGGGASCSPNKCVDLDTAETENVGNIDGSMLTDDGARSEDGACLDQMYIFSGRAQDCKLAGMSTAFKNCCASDGKALADTAGSYLSASQKLSTIKTVYEAASRAYTAYTGATAAGATASAAAAQGVAAAQQYLMVAFDPTTLAISIAIYVVMKYLATACDQLSTETALLADSGYCHEVGTYCKKKIKFIGCVQKAKAYCCFNSKLARIIHEQGRPQLNTGINNWGTPENPLCRGFTPEEFQSVDFGKVDLTEYINDIQKNANEQIQATMQSITSDFIEQTH